MKYRLMVSPAGEKFMMRLPGRDYQAVRQAIDSLADEPWPAQSRTVVGSDYLKLRVGRYRVIYAVDPKEKVVYVEGLPAETKIPIKDYKIGRGEWI